MNPTFSRQVKESLTKVPEINKNRQRIERPVLDGISVKGTFEDNLAIVVNLLKEHARYYEAKYHKEKTIPNQPTFCPKLHYAVFPNDKRCLTPQQLLDVVVRDIPKVFDVAKLPLDAQELVSDVERCLTAYMADIQDERARSDALKVRAQRAEDDLRLDKQASIDVSLTLWHWSDKLKADPRPYSRKDDSDFAAIEARRTRDYARFCEARVPPSEDELRDYQQCVAVVADVHDANFKRSATADLDAWRQMFADRGVVLS